MSSVKELFFDVLSRGGNLTELCDLTARLIGTPVAITITTRTIIAKSQDYSEDLVQEYTSSLLLCTPEEIEVQTLDLEKRLNCRKATIAILPYLKHKRINCGCFYKSKLIGVLDCPVIAKIDTEKALEIVGIATKAFTAALQLNGYVAAEQLQDMQIFLASLLKGTADINLQQKNLYNSMLEHVLQWRLVYAEPTSSENAEQLIHLISRFTANNKTVWHIEHRDGIILLLDNAVYKKTLSVLEEFSAYGIISVSEVYDNIYLTQTHYEMCLITSKIAQFENTGRHLFFVKNYKTLIHFLVFAQRAENNEYEDFTFSDIITYDNEHGTEYFDTLKAYLLCEQSISRIADRLHLHKNTVGYRLQRIEELFGIRLKDCRTISSLYFSLMQRLIFTPH